MEDKVKQAVALAAALEEIEAYIPTVYKDYSEPDLDADHLNHAENGIERVTSALNGAIGAIKTLQAGKIDTSKIVNNLLATDPSTVLAGPVGKSLQDQVTQLNGEMGVRTVTQANTNLNDYITAGTYYFSTAYTPGNIPAGINGWLVVMDSEVTAVKQLWYRHGTANSNDFQTYVRTKTGEGFGNWERYVTGAEWDSTMLGINITTYTEVSQLGGGITTLKQLCEKLPSRSRFMAGTYPADNSPVSGLPINGVLTIDKFSNARCTLMLQYSSGTSTKAGDIYYACWNLDNGVTPWTILTGTVV